MASGQAHAINDWQDVASRPGAEPTDWQDVTDWQDIGTSASPAEGLLAKQGLGAPSPPTPNPGKYMQTQDPHWTTRFSQGVVRGAIGAVNPVNWGEAIGSIPHMGMPAAFGGYPGVQNEAASQSAEDLIPGVARAKTGDVAGGVGEVIGGVGAGYGMSKLHLPERPQPIPGALHEPAKLLGRTLGMSAGPPDNPVHVNRAGDALKAAEIERGTSTTGAQDLRDLASIAQQKKIDTYNQMKANSKGIIVPFDKLAKTSTDPYVPDAARYMMDKYKTPGMTVEALDSNLRRLNQENETLYAKYPAEQRNKANNVPEIAENIKEAMATRTLMYNGMDAEGGNIPRQLQGEHGSIIEVKNNLDRAISPAAFAPTPSMTGKALRIAGGAYRAVKGNLAGGLVDVTKAAMLNPETIDSNVAKAMRDWPAPKSQAGVQMPTPAEGFNPRTQSPPSVVNLPEATAPYKRTTPAAVNPSFNQNSPLSTGTAGYVATPQSIPQRLVVPPAKTAPAPVPEYSKGAYQPGELERPVETAPLAPVKPAKQAAPKKVAVPAEWSSEWLPAEPDKSPGENAVPYY